MRPDRARVGDLLSHPVLQLLHHSRTLQLQQGVVQLGVELVVEVDLADFML